jgi:hypothetical protein
MAVIVSPRFGRHARLRTIGATSLRLPDPAVANTIRLHTLRDTEPFLLHVTTMPIDACRK